MNTIPGLDGIQELLDRARQECEPRLDDGTASRKLVVAAAVYGAEAAAKHARVFASDSCCALGP